MQKRDLDARERNIAERLIYFLHLPQKHLKENGDNFQKYSLTHVWGERDVPKPLRPTVWAILQYFTGSKSSSPFIMPHFTVHKWLYFDPTIPATYMNLSRSLGQLFFLMI
jgi:hypothetical protein